MDKVKVRIINHSNNPIPRYITEGSAGVDIYANIKNTIVIKPFERVLIPTGFFIELPNGYEAQIRPRSGLALKKGLTLVNSPGTIDSDYRGEIGIIMINLSQEEQIIEPADRIAQMVITRYSCASFVKVDTLEDTERGEGGFGHSGNK